MKFDILNRITGAVQFSAEIDCLADALPSVKLGLAVKVAFKRGADLSSAYLRGANLRGANLIGADLGEQWIIQGATRSDGYAFFLQKLKDDKEPMVKAGCRHFTLAQAEKHWTETRGETALGLETQAIVRGMVTLAHIRKLMPVTKTAEAVAA